MPPTNPDSRAIQRDRSLTGNVFLRFIVIGMMYLSQGLPLGLFGLAIPTYLAELGVYDKSQIGWYITFIGLPWAFKFLAGPLMDRVAFLIYGHRRPWVVIAQSGMVLTFAVSAVLTGWTDTTIFLLTCIGFGLNLFASTQDVAIDGLAIGVLKERERSMATALMFGSQRIGNLIGAVGGGYMLGNFGYAGACAAGAFATFFIMLFPLLCKERPIEKRFPWSDGAISPDIADFEIERIWDVLRSLVQVLIVPVSLFFIFASFCDSVAGGLLGAYLPSYSVQDLGWSDDEYNVWMSAVNLTAAGIGLLLSPLFDWFGQRRCIVILCVTTFIGIVAFVLIPDLHTDLGWRAFMVFFWTAQHLFAVLIISACMQLVTPSVAASQFAIYMSIANLSSTIGNSVIGLVGEILSVESLLLIAACLVLVAPLFFNRTNLGMRESKAQ